MGLLQKKLKLDCEFQCVAAEESGRGIKVSPAKNRQRPKGTDMKNFISPKSLPWIMGIAAVVGTVLMATLCILTMLIVVAGPDHVIQLISSMH